MKKILIVMTLVLFAGCTQTTTTNTTVTNSWPEDKSVIVDDDGSVWHVFSSESLGVKFEYMDKFMYEKLFPVTIEKISGNQSNKIIFVELQADGSMAYGGDDQTLEIFTKPAEQSIEDAITGIVLNSNGRDSSNCIAKDVTKDSGPFFERCDNFGCTTEAPKMGFVYRIFSANPIPYTTDQLKQIEQRKKDYNAAQNGPETADFMKLEFDDQNLVEACSTYAEQAGLGTSKSLPGYFLYTPSVNKTTFVFVLPQFDPLVYRNLTFVKGY